MQEKDVQRDFWIARLVHHPWFSRTILTLILLNAVLVGLETYPVFYQPFRSFFQLADQILLAIFTVEIALRILASNPYHHYFRDGWNVFDFLLIAGSHLLVNAQFVIVLRILRVLRVLRAVTTVPTLRRLVKTLLLTIPSLGNILVLLGIVFYIFGVIGTILFRDVSPEYFGSLHASLLTLFQVITLEAWASDVMRPVMEKAPGDGCTSSPSFWWEPSWC